MTNPIPAENTMSMGEVSEAFAKSFGGLVGQLTLQNLTLEKQNQSLKLRLNEVEEVTFGLKQDNANFTRNQIALEEEVKKAEAASQAIQDLQANETVLIDRIQQLEREIQQFVNFRRNHGLINEGDTADQIAAAGRAIIADSTVKEKAAD